MLTAVPTAYAQVCSKTGGTVYCPNGVTGFQDSDGDIWIGKGRRGTVILNLDDPPAQEAPRRKPKFELLPED